MDFFSRYGQLLFVRSEKNVEKQKCRVQKKEGRLKRDDQLEKIHICARAGVLSFPKIEGTFLIAIGILSSRFLSVVIPAILRYIIRHGVAGDA